MHVLTTLLTLILAVGAHAKLQEVNNNTFTLDGRGKIYVFVAEWCGHCQAFKPEVKKAASQIPEVVELIDFDKNPGLGGRFIVRSLPSVFHSNPVKDSPREWRPLTNVPRSAEGFVEYFQQKKWQETPPMTSWLNPESYIAQGLSMTSQFGFFVISLGHNLNKYVPYWAMFATGVALLAGVIMLICFLPTGYDEAIAKASSSDKKGKKSRTNSREELATPGRVTRNSSKAREKKEA